MSPGEPQKAKPRSGWRATCLLAALAAAGCGEGSTQTPADLPPLPQYWQGASYSSGFDEWTTSPQSAPPTSAAPYVIPQWPGQTAGPRYRSIDRQAAPNNGDTPAEPTTALSPLPDVAEVAPSTDPTLPVEGQSRAGSAPSQATIGALLAPRRAPAIIAAQARDSDNNQAQPSMVDASRTEGLEWFHVSAAERASAPDSTAADPFGEADEPLTFPTTADQATRKPPGSAPSPEPEELLAVAVPTGAVVSQRAAVKTRHGYALASRGAYFAARREFVDVLCVITDAKDQLHGAPRRTIALDEGLRALDEAADFASLPAGADARLTAAVIVSSHRTPAAKSLAVEEMLPGQLADLYLGYAQRQLGASVAGEPAGSMALHALGKLHSQLCRVEPENHPLGDRQAFALQQAALLARSDNHLAAHELGVLLAEAGHYPEAQSLLNQVAAHAPHPVVYRNLARVQRQLGRPDLAAASERQAEYLAVRDGGASAPVQWVTPAALSQTPDALGHGGAPPRMAAAPAQQPWMAAPMPMAPQGPSSFVR
jgi:hypothetical protein